LRRIKIKKWTRGGESIENSVKKKIENIKKPV